MWPFSGATGSPLIGAPLGEHVITGASVCFDPVSWFRRGVISNPGMFLLGLPGLGKSTLLRRMVMGLAGYGVRSLILGDLKPDYADLVDALGGQVVSLGRGVGSLNPLDAGALGQVAGRLTGTAAAEVRHALHDRQLSMISALVSIARGPARGVDLEEQTILSAALRVLAAHHEDGEAPLLADLSKVLEDAPEEIRAVVLDRGDDQRYRAAVDPLQKSLHGLLEGELGAVFGRPTSVQMDIDASAVCMDLSRLRRDAGMQVQAAALIATWASGFAAIAGAQALHDAGLAPRRNYFVVMDELWRVLRAGGDLVDRVDEITRLDRQEGVGSALCTHTLADLRALPSEEDRAKARGLAERCSVLVSGGLPRRELDDLAGIVSFSREEEAYLTHWSDAGSWNTETGQRVEPAGQGKFLIKAGRRPGVPVDVRLTAAEVELNDTNKRWQMERGELLD
jgi:hypothetical protein